ncbi:hypothetical protein IQ276_030745 [Desmonostoc muscorum LEGE 12446]|uniref:Uncharacterized protein n=1 Tax=Desmonostoc muscorum LEGE 12446 TaxID=1828758 RepID=A0A8J6ZPQ0_DESMC|nr:hypothetical protein [Desmonostoc muscorum]MCF2150725.1 hypothetical protein [Desmonostoc muscorum LEGE 12446]
MTPRLGAEELCPMPDSDRSQSGNSTQIVRFYHCHLYTNGYNLLGSSEVSTLDAVSRS